HSMFFLLSIPSSCLAGLIIWCFFIISILLLLLGCGLNPRLSLDSQYRLLLFHFQNQGTFLSAALEAPKSLLIHTPYPRYARLRILSGVEFIPKFLATKAGRQGQPN